MRIAALGLHHETNTFSSFPTTYEGFSTSSYGGLLRGAEIESNQRASHSTFAGYFQAADEFGFDLTPCSEEEPFLCTAAQGQSADSNEQLVMTIPSGCSGGCDFYVVVHGWDGSTNSYSIAMSVQ